MRRDRARVGERLLRLTRRPGGGALPADVAAILALSPDVYFDLRFPALPGLGQVLWQDAARTTTVAGGTDPIGSALNLGSLGGYAESSGTARPVWLGATGSAFDGVDDFLQLAGIGTVAQPMTHLLYLESIQWTSGNRYPVDSIGGSAVRHNPLGLGNAFGAFPNGHLIAAAPTVNRFNWGGGTVARRQNFLVVTNGASSRCVTEGDITFDAGTFNVGANGQEGVLLGSAASLTSFMQMQIKAYFRIPSAVASGDFASLLSIIP